MYPKERIAIALQGGKPDRAPILAHYSYEYIMHSLGRDPREWVTASAADRIHTVEAMFGRHDVDGYFVYPGVNDDFVNSHAIEKRQDYWIVTNRESGEQYRLLSDGQRVNVDGTPILSDLSTTGEAKIQTWDDLDREVPRSLTEAEFEASGRYWTLRHMAKAYPDYHFSIGPGSLVGMAMAVCGGFEAGLLLMSQDRELFKEVMHRVTQYKRAFLLPGKKAGASSVWLTSMYTGADIMSPRDYADVVFPYEYELCQATRDLGLSVMDWFLGDLMPILGKVAELPIDSLLLEQGRGAYIIDPVEIRRQVGPRLCLHGFGYELDYVEFNRDNLSNELERQIEGAGRDGAFIVGTSIVPANAQPEAVDHYFREARRMGQY